MRPNETDRYLVQFCRIGTDDWTDDCPFRDGQLDTAKSYLERVIATQPHLIGRIYDYDDDVYHELAIDDEPVIPSRYIVQFQEWGIDQPWKTAPCLPFDKLERAMAYIEGVLTTPKAHVQAGRVWDRHTDKRVGENPIVHCVRLCEMDLGSDLARNNVTCQPTLFGDAWEGGQHHAT